MAISWDFHWKALLQPKGFLKILELVLAILAFSLVAGYTAIATSKDCNRNGTILSYKYTTSYTYNEIMVTRTSNGTVGSPVSHPSSQVMISAGRQGSFFVAMGVMTLFYCLIAEIVYVVTMASAERLGRVYDFLVYMDFGCNIFWVVMWLIAASEWASGGRRLVAAFLAVISTGTFNDCPAGTFQTIETETVIRLQSDIAVAFGFLNVFVWGCNIWWALKDCPFYMAWRERVEARRQAAQG